MLAACGSVPLPPQPPQAPASPAPASPAAPAGALPLPPDDGAPLAPALVQGKSRWQPVRWSELPGFGADTLHDAWNAWLRSCERPSPQHARLCPEVRRLSIASADEQREWMMRRLQPYRVEPLQGGSDSLLTGYYEPVLDATRQPTATHQSPLYRPPADLATRRPWYTKQEIDTLPQARAALRGREIAWLADPLDALVLQIQGSGRLRIAEPDGRVSVVRMAYAGTNEQPYRSVGSWLLQQRAITDASWPGIKAWARANPQRLQEMLWANPRVVFFREEPLSELDAAFGPRGAQGVPLTPGRSIAVPVRHAGVAVDAGPGAVVEPPGLRPGHRQRHRRRRPRRLFRRLGRCGGRDCGASQAATCLVGSLATLGIRTAVRKSRKRGSESSQKNSERSSGFLLRLLRNLRDFCVRLSAPAFRPSRDATTKSSCGCPSHWAG
ncbi:MAG: rane-bound lytic murein transglycosylase precursor (Murein hydrolase A)-like protein [Ramlibacter sp.]|nr:rane-bound lytic murein transglycosylase precursor (Murein hydrolase A)-like protein [Ramlibacter sp.]